MVAMSIFVPRKRRRTLTRFQRSNLTFFGFLTPWLFGLIFLTFIPLIISLIISFTNYDGLNWDSMKFIQFRNYTRAFGDPEVSHSLRQTLIWLVLYLPLWMTIPFILALLLNQIRTGKGFYRVLYYIPSLIPASAAMLAWRSLLDKNYGVLNALISIYRPGTAIGWLSNYSLQVLTAIVIWSSLGTGMIIFLAGLQDVPDELLEAARIDGANNWQTFWKVILPLMTPIIFFQLIVGLINVFQQLTFVLLMVFSGGMGHVGIPPQEIYFYIFNAYHQIIANQRQGYGAALLWLLFIGIVVLSLVVFWSQRFWVHTRESAE
jgi:multiple sugar transport system permease protein